MILVNNLLDAKFFMYVYIYSLHVSGIHVPIIRKIIVSMPHLVYVTLFISILYMFRAAMCPSSGELLYQCDTWFMSLCLFLFSTCFGQPCANHQENYCINATPGLCQSV